MVEIKLKNETVSQVLLSFEINEDFKNKEFKFTHPRNFNTSDITNRAIELLMKEYSKKDKIVIHDARLRLTMF